MAKKRPSLPRIRLAAKARAEQAAVAVRDAELMEEAKRQIVHRDSVLRDLEAFRQISALDYFEEVAPGEYKMKSLDELRKLGPAHLRYVRKIRMTTNTRTLMDTGDTVTTSHATVELPDILAVEKMIGDYLGMWQKGDVHQHLHLMNAAGQAPTLAGAPADQVRERRLVLERELKAVDAQITEGEQS